MDQLDRNLLWEILILSCEPYFRPFAQLKQVCRTWKLVIESKFTMDVCLTRFFDLTPVKSREGTTIWSWEFQSFFMWATVAGPHACSLATKDLHVFWPPLHANTDGVILVGASDAFDRIAPGKDAFNFAATFAFTAFCARNLERHQVCLDAYGSEGVNSVHLAILPFNNGQIFDLATLELMLGVHAEVGDLTQTPPPQPPPGWPRYRRTKREFFAGKHRPRDFFSSDDNDMKRDLELFRCADSDESRAWASWFENYWFNEDSRTVLLDSRCNPMPVFSLRQFPGGFTMALIMSVIYT